MPKYRYRRTVLYRPLVDVHAEILEPQPNIGWAAPRDEEMCLAKCILSQSAYSRIVLLNYVVNHYFDMTFALFKIPHFIALLHCHTFNVWIFI